MQRAPVVREAGNIRDLVPLTNAKSKANLFFVDWNFQRILCVFGRVGYLSKVISHAES